MPWGYFSRPGCSICNIFILFLKITKEKADCLELRFPDDSRNVLDKTTLSPVPSVTWQLLKTHDKKSQKNFILSLKSTIPTTMTKVAIF